MTRKTKKKAKTVITDLAAKQEMNRHTQSISPGSVSLALLCTALILVLSVFAAGKEKDKKPAQDQKPADYALLFGTLWSADDRPVMGATIKIRRADQKKAKWALFSDRRGEFAQRVPAEKADYIVWAEIPKKKGHLAETTVHVEGNERVDFGLHLKE